MRSSWVFLLACSLTVALACSLAWGCTGSTNKPPADGSQGAKSADEDNELDPDDALETLDAADGDDAKPKE